MQMKIVSDLGEKNNELVESIMRKCEHEEDFIYKKFVVLLNTLHNKYNVDLNIVSELEDLYIEKGLIYCSTFMNLEYSKVVSTNC